MQAKNLLNQKFGRLFVLKRAENKNGRVMWLCKCECGKEATVRGSHLILSRTVSCGCFVKDSNIRLRRTHGKTKTRIYRIWRDMINRCHYEHYPERHYYADKGVIVCDRWRYSFVNFLADMGEPENHLSIDRINPFGNYEPLNCRWATAAVQANNTRKKYKGNQELGVQFTIRA